MSETQTQNTSKAYNAPARLRDGTERPDLTRCSQTTDKGRRCKLNAGHDGDHAYVLRSAVPAPKHITEVTPQGFSLTMERIPTTDDLSIDRQRTEAPRDEWQTKVDKDVDKAYKSWVKAGSPDGTFEELAPKYGGRYMIPPAAFDSVVAMLRRSVTGSAPASGKGISYRRKAHENGQTMVYFLATDKKHRTAANGGTQDN